MAEPALQLKTLFLIVSVGAMLALMVAIFAKRQILRYQLKSNRGPHAYIGADAPKSLRREIERRLTRVDEIKEEPRLLSDVTEANIFNACSSPADLPHFFYRMKAVDNLALLESELRQFTPRIRRDAGSDLEEFLVLQCQGQLKDVPVDLVHQFALSFEHARHDPAKFGKSEFDQYMQLLQRLIVYVQKIRSESTTETCTLDSNRQSPKVMQITYRPSTRTTTPGLVFLSPRSASESSLGRVSQTSDGSEIITPV